MVSAGKNKSILGNFAALVRTLVPLRHSIFIPTYLQDSSYGTVDHVRSLKPSFQHDPDHSDTLNGDVEDDLSHYLNLD